MKFSDSFPSSLPFLGAVLLAGSSVGQANVDIGLSEDQDPTDKVAGVILDLAHAGGSPASWYEYEVLEPILTEMTADLLTALAADAAERGGDYNGDGTVDVSDYLIWQGASGTTADGDVDGRDYLNWQRPPGTTAEGDVEGRDFLIWQDKSGTTTAGDVDGRDFLIWRDEFGTAAEGDVDGRDFVIWRDKSGTAADGDVDSRDYLIWQRSPGMTAEGDVDAADYLVWRDSLVESALQTVWAIDPGDLSIWQTNFGNTAEYADWRKCFGEIAFWSDDFEGVREWQLAAEIPAVLLSELQEARISGTSRVFGPATLELATRPGVCEALLLELAAAVRK
ncbi:hypothetical protein [Luteolibacter marinus]|uniref:hypothetical protein n=1 Tax=Luteolibacter marinus TaxID=2776705 RepID=UPI001866F751|nr:hypothetical protein [Luteolibacter marinus]